MQARPVYRAAFQFAPQIQLAFCTFSDLARGLVRRVRTHCHYCHRSRQPAGNILYGQCDSTAPAAVAQLFQALTLRNAQKCAEDARKASPDARHTNSEASGARRVRGILVHPFRRLWKKYSSGFYDAMKPRRFLEALERELAWSAIAAFIRRPCCSVLSSCQERCHGRGGMHSRLLC